MSYKILLFLVIIGLLLFNVTFAELLRPDQVLKQWFLPRKDKQQDLIGLRVAANPQNYSIQRWYKEKGFLGNPVSTVVDGYPALQDGRTIYVSAANFLSTKLYTNVYLISYNENAEPETIEIFNRLLKKWRFNLNLLDEEKPKLKRDTLRIGTLKDIETLLERYKNKKGFYPKLQSGSYQSGFTVSTWPSWQRTLAVDLGVSGLPIDPINKLGQCLTSTDACWTSATTAVCGGYEKVTCWNETEKKFADPASVNFRDLPSGSNIYFYEALNNGNGYRIGSPTEFKDWKHTNTCGGPAGIYMLCK